MSDNKYFNPEGVAKPGGDYSHVAEFPPGSRVLYTAGQVGVARDGSFPDDFRQQADNTWQNLVHILGDDKMTANNIIKVIHYLEDAADIPAYREVYRKYFGNILPASTLLVIKQLARPDFRLEVEIVAATTQSPPPQRAAESMRANRYFNPDNMTPPFSQYTHGVAIPPGSRIVHTAGQVGVGDDGTIPPGFVGQAENLWRNLSGILAGDGLNWGDVVKVNHYLTNREDIAAYRNIFLSHLGEAAPAATLVIVEALAMPELKLEVEIVAATL
jgi:2-iminobutanoate/2-iminopropanoate deaminase